MKNNHSIYIIVFLVLSIQSIAFADIDVLPKDLSKILRQVGDYQKRLSAPLKDPATIVEKDGVISLLNKSGQVNASVTFNSVKTIAKHINMEIGPDHYKFAAILQNTGAPYEHTITKINASDALVYFNDMEVFVYTQNATPQGGIELKEWIYARRPNSLTGSSWLWVFKSEQWQWPLSMDLDEQGQAQVYRNMPIAMKGLTIADQAKSQYMLNMLVHYNQDEHVNKYFPFKDPIAVIPPSVFWTKEGVQRQADIQVANKSVTGQRPKPKHGLDFAAWDDHFQTTFKIEIKADPKDYPLMIDPSIRTR